MADVRRPWPDVPRLLQKRKQFTDLGDSSLASSVTAFLAWKALLIVAKGSQSGDEKQQCTSIATTVLAGHPAVWTEAYTFARALRAFTQASSAVVQEWYCDQSWDTGKSVRHAEWAVRSIREANELVTSGSKSESLAALIADHAYGMRSATLAHASVQSTGNLFQHIVPPFDRLTCRLACAAWADRAGVSLEAGMEECGVA